MRNSRPLQMTRGIPLELQSGEMVREPQATTAWMGGSRVSNTLNIHCFSSVPVNNRTPIEGRAVGSREARSNVHELQDLSAAA